MHSFPLHHSSSQIFPNHRYTRLQRTHQITVQRSSCVRLICKCHAHRRSPTYSVNNSTRGNMRYCSRNVGYFSRFVSGVGRLWRCVSRCVVSHRLVLRKPPHQRPGLDLSLESTHTVRREHDTYWVQTRRAIKVRTLHTLLLNDIAQ